MIMSLLLSIPTLKELTQPKANPTSTFPEFFQYNSTYKSRPTIPSYKATSTRKMKRITTNKWQDHALYPSNWFSLRCLRSLWRPCTRQGSSKNINKQYVSWTTKLMSQIYLTRPSSELDTAKMFVFCLWVQRTLKTAYEKTLM